MLQYDLVIIGGGASGLSAGVEALKNGVKKVLILERNPDLGGNLNLFIHVGFGKGYLEEAVTGPEFASRLISDYKNLGGEYQTDAYALNLSEKKIITMVSPGAGVKKIKGKAVILASGCREKFTGNIIVPIHRFTGIFTLAAAHRLINIKGYLPGKDVVIVGKNKWSLLVARRLLVEGANVKAVIDNSLNGFTTEEELEIIDSFKINIVKDSEVIELMGDEKISKVKTKNKKTNEVTKFNCDSLILTVGYYPELDCVKKLSVEVDEDGILEVCDYKTSIDGIYACGTILNGEVGICCSAKEGNKTGKIVSDYINKVK